MVAKQAQIKDYCLPGKPGKNPGAGDLLLRHPIRPSPKFARKSLSITETSHILSQPIEYLKGVGPLRADMLKKELGLFTFGDLLNHFPYRHVDKTRVTRIIDLSPSME